MAHSRLSVINSSHIVVSHVGRRAFWFLKLSAGHYAPLVNMYKLMEVEEVKC